MRNLEIFQDPPLLVNIPSEKVYSDRQLHILQYRVVAFRSGYSKSVYIEL